MFCAVLVLAPSSSSKARVSVICTGAMQAALAAEAAAFASDGHDGVHEPLLHPEEGNLMSGPASPVAIGRSSSSFAAAAAAIGPQSTSLQRIESGCAAKLSDCQAELDCCSAACKDGPANNLRCRLSSVSPSHSRVSFLFSSRQDVAFCCTLFFSIQSARMTCALQTGKEAGLIEHSLVQTLDCVPDAA